MIELLVVLTIIGLIGAVALPKLRTMADRVAVALDRDAIEVGLANLGRYAFATGSEIVLAGADATPFALPEGWAVRAEQPIRFRINGSCTGGRIEFRSGTEILRYHLAPPRCRPQRMPG